MDDESESKVAPIAVSILTNSLLIKVPAQGNERDDDRSKPKGWIRENTRVGQVLDVKVTNYLERYGIEVKIDSTQNDGSQTWIVFSRGMDKYVTELSEENEKPIHFEEVAPSAGKPVATKQQKQYIPSSSSSSSTVMPIDQRKWNDISAVGKIDDNSYKISKLMTRLLRHQGYLREDDGTIEWRKFLPLFYREHCLDPNGFILHMRAIQGHCGGNKS